MAKSIRELLIMGLLVGIFAWSALATEAPANSSDPNAGAAEEPASVLPILSRDFRINVQTNRTVYRNRDVLSLAVKLLNDDVRPVFIGVCPIANAEELPEEATIEELAQGYLEDVDVDVAVMPCIPRFIGYATLTRLGPSPVPCPSLSAAEAADAAVKPKKFRLPLFRSPRVPGHSTRIISVANILISGPLLDVEAEPLPIEDVSAEVVADAESNSLEIEAIPAVGRYIPLKPGYYLLNCYIERICGTRVAQAQKIIRIRPRVIRPVPRQTAKPEEPLSVIVR